MVRLPESAVNTPVTTMMPRIQPTRNPTLVPAAWGENSIRIAAMIGIGEIADPQRQRQDVTDHGIQRGLHIAAALARLP